MRVLFRDGHGSATGVGTSLYQGQQGDVDQSVHGKYKVRLSGGTKYDSSEMHNRFMMNLLWRDVGVFKGGGNNIFGSYWCIV